MTAVPTAYTWTVGELQTAAKMNAYLRDLATFLLNRPSARLRHSVTQSLTTSTSTALLLDTEDTDTDGGHSTVTNTSRYTCQTAGTWLAMASVPWTGNATGKRETYFRVNNTTDYHSVAIDCNRNVTHATATSGLIPLSVGDYVEIWGYQDTGAGLGTNQSFHRGVQFSLIWESA